VCVCVCVGGWLLGGMCGTNLGCVRQTDVWLIVNIDA
jgi:hypothetical protein